jgi:hypothetical protein
VPIAFEQRRRHVTRVRDDELRARPVPVERPSGVLREDAVVARDQHRRELGGDRAGKAREVDDAQMSCELGACKGDAPRLARE